MNSDGRIDARELTVMKCAIISAEMTRMGGRYTLTVNGNTVAIFQVSSKLTK